MAKTNPDFIAQVVLDSMYASDEEVARKHNISMRTVRNYRKLVEADSGVAAVFQLKKMKSDEAWAHQIPGALRAVLKWVEDSMPSMPPTPDTLHAAAGAAKLLSEIEMTRRIIDDRLSKRLPPLLPDSTDKKKDE